MNRDAILEEFRKSSDYAELEEYVRLTDDKRPLDDLHEEYVELVDGLTVLDELSEEEGTTILQRTVDKMFEPVGQLDGHATSVVWKQIAQLDEPTSRAVTRAVAGRFSSDNYLGPWSTLVFVFDEFEETVQESFDLFLSRDDFHERLSERARAMARFVAFPRHPTAKTRQEFGALLSLGEVRDQVRRVVDYGARHIGLNHARVDAALVFLLAVSGGERDETLLRRVWSVVQTRPLEPKLTAARFERLIAVSENFPGLADEIRQYLARRYAELDSVDLLSGLSSEEWSFQQLRDARFQLTVCSQGEQGGGRDAASSYCMSLVIRPGYSELVADDREADWLVRLSRIPDGTSHRYTHRGLDRQASRDPDVELSISRPHDFPSALAEASRQLNVDWDLSLQGLANGKLSQTKVNVDPAAILQWLRSEM